MSDGQPIYLTGPEHPESEPYYWVRCQVSVPSTDGSPGGDMTMDAKVEVGDVIDALDLDRWTTQAFQYIWRSGNKPGNPVHQELAKAQWFLGRSARTFHGDWQATTVDTVANILDFVLANFPPEEHANVMMALSRDLRQRDLRAVNLVANAYAEEMSKTPPPAPSPPEKDGQGGQG